MPDRKRIITELKLARKSGREAAVTEMFSGYCPDLSLSLALPLTILINGAADESIRDELRSKMSGEPLLMAENLFSMRHPAIEVSYAQNPEEYAITFYSDSLGKGDLTREPLRGYKTMDEAADALDRELTEATADLFISIIKNLAQDDRTREGLRENISSRPHLIF